MSVVFFFCSFLGILTVRQKYYPLRLSNLGGALFLPFCFITFCQQWNTVLTFLVIYTAFAFGTHLQSYTIKIFILYISKMRLLGFPGEIDIVTSVQSRSLNPD